MSKGRKRLLIILILISSIFSCSLLISYKYNRGPIRGQVLDQDTNQPIEGAVVYVEWRIPHFLDGRTFFDTREVLTNSEGKFTIPAVWSFSPWRNSIMIAEFLIYRRDYGYVELYYPFHFKEDEEARSKISPEQAKKMGPGFYYKIQFKGDEPIFLLKKLKKEEQGINVVHVGTLSDVPSEKTKLLTSEKNKEY